MALALARLGLVAVFAAAGAATAAAHGLALAAGVAVGAGAAALAVALEAWAGRLALRPLLWTAGGAVAGLLTGVALGTALAPLAGAVGPALPGAGGLLGAWVGGAVGARRAGELPGNAGPPAAGGERVLDTSAIIDGRIADVAEAGFLDGTVVVPRFVVGELQRLADSGDALRRGRARRGFDVLERLGRSAGVRLELVDTDFPQIADVDGKLVALARARRGRLLTGDAALGRMAALAGVTVGSLNDLATALRPVALPGESLTVQVQREGREAGQGVAYLGDGTMVVVEGGKRFLGQSLEVVVTSVLPTSAGRMIFARPRGEEGGRDA